MMRLKKIDNLPYLTLSAGGLGLILMLWLYGTGFDKKGLLVSGHPATILLIPLSAVVIVGTFLWVRSLGRAPGYSQLFPYSPLAAIGCCAGGLGVFVNDLAVLIRQPNAIHMLWLLLSGITGICFLYLGYCRGKQARPSFFFHAIVTVYFMLHAIDQYRHWNSEPQLLLYCFPLLATVFLMLSAYHHTTLDAGTGKRKLYVFFNQLSLFFCCLAIPGDNPLFYLTMALWTGTNLCSLRTAKKKAADKILLPEAVRMCIRMLEAAGFATYAVGGCIRDNLLGLTPSDYDLCTAATPAEIVKVFEKFDLVRNGEKHGTIGVIVENNLYEITTFRTESQYSDSRHPDAVVFVDNVEADLQRRDFTINAIAYSPTRGLIDPWGGQTDLRAGILRAVGNPETRFREDSLRILRGVRFAIKYELTPDPETEQAMQALAPTVDGLARERVFEELCKILVLATTQDMLRFLPIFVCALPELAPMVNFSQCNPHHIHDLYTHTAYVVGAAPRTLPLRWAALLHDIGKVTTFTQDEDGRGHFYGHAEESAKKADELLRRLHAPNALREQILFLIANHMNPLEPDRKLLRRRLSQYGRDYVYALFVLQRADFSGKGTGTSQEELVFDEIELLLTELLAEDACLSVKDLAINGRDILALGYEPGVLIGECMTYLLEKIQEETVPNEREPLLQEAQRFLQKKQEESQ